MARAKKNPTPFYLEFSFFVCIFAVKKNNH